MIDLEGVSKRFGTLPALDALSLHVERGRHLAILGPNGAGKTTIIRLLLGVLQPDRGVVEVFGEPISTAAFDSKRRIGVVIEEQMFFLDLTVWEYLEFFGALYRVTDTHARAAALLRHMQLYEVRNRTIRALSKGMTKKLTIVQAVLHRPELLIFDEPFSGLDMQGMAQTIHLMRAMQAAGSTLIVSSHILFGLDEIIDDVLVLIGGKAVAYGQKAQLGDDLGHKTIEAIYSRILLDAGYENLSVTKAGDAR